MNQFYPDKDDDSPETVWQFIHQRDYQRSANRRSAVSRMATAAAKKIEALIKQKPERRRIELVDRGDDK